MAGQPEKRARPARVFGIVFRRPARPIRAGALPRALELLEAAWGSLLPAVVEKNHLSLRDYLRTFTAPGSTLDKVRANVY